MQIITPFGAWDGTMYAVLARYYDLIHSELTEDLNFVLSIAREHAGPILELGCGTGRLLLPLVRAGHTVTGVDYEPSMLQRARQRLEQEEKCRGRAALIQADVRSLDLPGKDHKYGLALFSYNTMLHFQPQEVQQTLRSIRNYLTQDGRLFIDLPNPFEIEGTEYENYPVFENTFSVASSGETIIQKSHARLDSNEQCLHTTWYFESYKDSEQPVETVSVNVDYWYYFPHQIELLLQQSGFQLEQVMGDYNRSGFDEGSNRLLILGCPSE